MHASQRMTWLCWRVLLERSAWVAYVRNEARGSAEFVDNGQLCTDLRGPFCSQFKMKAGVFLPVWVNVAATSCLRAPLRRNRP